MPRLCLHRRRCRGLHQLGLSILLLSAEFGPLRAEEPAENLASYRNTVTAAELDGWRSFRGEEDTDRELALRDLIMVRSLAEAALGLGLDRQPEVRLEIEVDEGRLAQVTLRRHVNQSVVVTDEEAEAKYQEIKDTFTRPRRVRLRNLFKRYPLDATDADKQAVLAEMQQLRQRLLAGEDFGELAEQESDSQSRFRKGLLGNVPAGTFPPPIDQIVMAMQPGEISDILPSSDGLTILYCEKILEKVHRSPEELRDIARGWLERQAAKQAWADLEAEMRAKVDPRYRWHVLEAQEHDPKATLVEAHGSLSVADLERLVRIRSAAADPWRMPREELREEIDAYVLGRACQREVERRGLVDKDGLGMRWLWARRQVLATRATLHFVEAELEPPAEDEVRRYYDEHRDDFVRPAIFDLAAIRLPLESDSDREAYRRGERLVHRIRSGEISFEEAARRHSTHPSAADGGRIGRVGRWVLPHRFGFNVLRAVLRLEPGGISDLVAHEEEGLWILQLIDREDSRPMTYDEAHTAAENKVGTAHARALQARILDEWLARLDVETSP